MGGGKRRGERPRHIRGLTEKGPFYFYGVIFTEMGKEKRIDKAPFECKEEEGESTRKTHCLTLKQSGKGEAAGLFDRRGRLSAFREERCF